MTELQPVPEAPEPFNVSAELQKAIDSVMESITCGSYSQRHPELGKMVKCQVCSRRHRASQKCEQVFTYRIGDYELFREDEKGELVPDYRTAMRPNERHTKRQVAGSAAFAKKRLKPHPSKMKLLFIQKTREIFSYLDFPLDDKDENFQENLQRCRVLAARDIRAERESKERAARQRAELSRRINRAA